MAKFLEKSNFYRANEETTFQRQVNNFKDHLDEINDLIKHIIKFVKKSIAEQRKKPPVKEAYNPLLHNCIQAIFNKPDVIKELASQQIISDRIIDMSNAEGIPNWQTIDIERLYNYIAEEEIIGTGFTYSKLTFLLQYPNIHQLIYENAYQELYNLEAQLDQVLKSDDLTKPDN